MIKLLILISLGLFAEQCCGKNAQCTIEDNVTFTGKSCDFNHQAFDSKTCWNVDTAQIGSAKAIFDANYSECKGEDDDLFIFLLSKKAMPKTIDCRSIVNPRDTEEQNIKKRLVQIVRVGDEVHAQLPASVQSFEDFVSDSTTAVWGDPLKSTVAWRLFPGVNLCQRGQESGLCYFHAVDSMQCNLVSKAQGRPSGMLDMTSFIRKYFSGKRIREHVFTDDGGYTLSVLKQVMVPGTKLLYDGLSDKFISHFNRYGVGIIPAFEVYPEFLKNKLIHLEPAGNESELIGRHAILVVGYREEGSELRLLVQNWWPEKQFFETNFEYLRDHDAFIVFVETRQGYIPKRFSTYDGSYAMNFDRPSAYWKTEGKTYI